MNFQSILLSLVIPLFDEEDNIQQLLQNIDESLKGLEFEVILVDDFSTDRTVSQIKKLNHPKVKLIELRKNYGQSSALAAGFDNVEGDYIITLDGDLQNDPRDILPMLQKLEEENWDVVVGIRNKRKDQW